MRLVPIPENLFRRPDGTARHATMTVTRGTPVTGFIVNP
jgi:hypothetical protein